MTSLVRGQKVKVYQAPVTGDLLEGVATLLKCHNDKHDLEYWEVRFVGDSKDMIVPRWINPDDIMK